MKDAINFLLMQQLSEQLSVSTVNTGRVPHVFLQFRGILAWSAAWEPLTMYVLIVDSNL